MLQLIALFLAVAQAAPAPRDPRASALEERRGTAVVRGRVTDAETGAPLARVSVTLSLLSARAQLDTMTGADGAFQFTRVPAGAYTLLADPMSRRTTHRSTGYTAVPGKASAKNSVIHLQEGQVFDKADIALPRAFVISARVVDEEGEPVADMLVRAEAIDGRGGMRSRTTDDRGAVRLWGQAPATYNVCAVPQNVPDRGSAEGFVRTCYPSAVSESEAQPITITTFDPPEVEIRLRRTRLFRVSGVVLDASGGVAGNASVQLVTVEANHTSSRSVQVNGGSFEARGVAPGEYHLVAQAGDSADATRQSGYTTVNVQSSDVDGLALLLSLPVTVRGRLVFEGAPPPQAAKVKVYLSHPRGSIAQAAPRTGSVSTVAADLSFEMRGLSGFHVVEVNSPEGWIVKSMRYRGEERMYVPTEFKAPSDPSSIELDIIVSNRPARILARVFDEKGQSLDDARVVAFPTDVRQWDWMNTARWARPREGHYEMGALRPGEYFVVVVPEGMALGNDRRSMEELTKQAERMTLTEGEQRTIDLILRK